MGRIEFVGGKPIEVEQVNLSEKDINQIYKELGLNTPVQPRYRSIKRQSKAKDPYVRTIPLSWICMASSLPGKALHVGIVIWFLFGVNRSQTIILTRKWLNNFGLTPETGRRGLLALESAELVPVERCGKKCPTVTLEEPPRPPQQPLTAL